MPGTAAPPDTPVSSGGNIDTVQVELGMMKGGKISKEAQQVCGLLDCLTVIAHVARCVSCVVQIVAGVVLKYVNFAQGWQPRLLVLQDDTVRYWKVRAYGDA